MTTYVVITDDLEDGSRTVTYGGPNARKAAGHFNSELQRNLELYSEEGPISVPPGVSDNGLERSITYTACSAYRSRP